MTTPGENTRDLNTEPLNIKINKPLKERLEAYCDDSGLSQAAAVRLALGQFLIRNGYPKEAR